MWEGGSAALPLSLCAGPGSRATLAAEALHRAGLKDCAVRERGPPTLPPREQVERHATPRLPGPLLSSTSSTAATQAQGRATPGSVGISEAINQAAPAPSAGRADVLRRMVRPGGPDPQPSVRAADRRAAGLPGTASAKSLAAMAGRARQDGESGSTWVSIWSAPPGGPNDPRGPCED